LRLAYIADGANEGALREARSLGLTGLCLGCVIESFLCMMKLSHFERGIVPPLLPLVAWCRALPDYWPRKYSGRYSQSSWSGELYYFCLVVSLLPL